MSEEIQTKPKGKAIELKLEDDFLPNISEIKEAQKFASEVSPFLLQMLEANEE